MNQVVITGTGIVSALGDSPSAVHAALCEGVSAIRPVAGYDSDGLLKCWGAPIADFAEKKYFGPKNLRPLDRLSRLAAAAAKLALDDAGWTPELLRPCEAGMALGTMFGAAHTIGQFDRSALTKGPGGVSPLDFPNTVMNAAAGQSAIWHGLTGVNSTITTGITAGLHAIGYGTELIRSGRANVIVAGGAEEFSLESVYGFQRAGMLCGSHGEAEPLPVPFHARRNGLAIGEGTAFVVLEERDFAEARGARILAVIRGHGTTQDASRGDDEKSSMAAIARSIRLALAEAEVAPDQIDCLSASASGSVWFDAREGCAAAQALGGAASRVPVTAIKSMLGETLGASGAMQLVDLVETMRQGVLPGIPHLSEVDAGLPLRMAGPENREVDARIGLVNSVGHYGSCCSVVVARENRS